MNTIQFFEQFLEEVKKTTHWSVMRGTVEDSPWHREANVAVHTLMTINVYMDQFAGHRTEREQMFALMALLFHDFGKPDAEETKEKKEQPGVFYRTYAGHEPISGNEFLSFMCDQHRLRRMFFAQGFGWNDVRTIKFMIEHHLPYGLKNPTKRQDLRQAIALTMGAEEESFWDMLRSDSKGRISDDHEQKLKNVEDFIAEFRHIPVKAIDTVTRLRQKFMPFAVSMNADGSTTIDGSFEKGMEIAESRQKTLFMLMGVSGAGKSTWVKNLKGDFIVVNEDDWRLEYAGMFMDRTDVWEMRTMTTQERYDVCWKFCHLHNESAYNAFARLRFEQILDMGKHVVLDRMNQGKKGRGKWINVAKAKGFKIHSVEFFISEKTAVARQITRGDKSLPPHRVHQVYMQQEVPWLGPEVDGFEIVAPD